MSMQPDTDAKLARTSGRLSTSGGRLLAVSGVLALLGAILLITGASTVAGLMCLGLCLPPLIGGVALLGSAGVGKRAAEHKDFA